MDGFLGSLIVQITTDLTNLNAGLKKAEENVKNTSGKITDLVNKIGTTMTVAGAAITGAFTLMIKSTVDYNEEIYRVSQQSGIAVDKLSELKYIADQTESSFEAVATAMKFLNRNIYDAVSGNSKAADSFNILGVSIRNQVTGETLKANDVFLALADKFKNLNDESAKTALAIQIFGRSGTSVIPILNLGSEGITKLSENAHRLGIVLTTENAKAIDQFGDDTRSLKDAVGGLWLNISLLLIPALEKLVKWVTDVVVKIREWSERHPVLSKFISETTLALGALMLIFGPIILAFNQLAKAVIYLNMVLPLLNTNLVTLKASLLALWPVALAVGAIFAGLKIGEWLDNNKKKIQDFWNWANDKMHPMKKGPVMNFDIGSSLDKEFPSGAKPASENTKTENAALTEQNTILDQTITKVEQHAQKLKEVNDNYLAGKISASEYYEAIVALHADGLDIKQQELDLLNQSIELERLATEEEYQKIYVMNEGIRTAQEYYQIKAELENQDLMNQQTTLSAATNLLQTIQGMHKTIWGGIFDFINMGIQKFSSGFSTALSSIILGTKSASEAFKDFGKMMIEAIVNFVVEYGVQALLAMALSKFLCMFVTGVANSIADAWLPAATLASIATMGGADAVGAVGLAAALVSTKTLLGGMQSASGAASGFTTLGEGGIVTRPTLALIGEAGPEGVYPLDKAGSMGNTFDIKINIESPVISSDIDIEDLGDQLGESIERKMNQR